MGMRAWNKVENYGASRYLRMRMRAWNKVESYGASMLQDPLVEISRKCYHIRV